MVYNYILLHYKSSCGEGGSFMQAYVCKRLGSLSEKILSTVSSAFKKDSSALTSVDASLSYDKGLYDELFMNEDLFVNQTDKMNDCILEPESGKQPDLNIYKHPLTMEERKFLGF